MSQPDAPSAAEALSRIRRGRSRSAALRGYAGAGSILIAWGLAWLVGNVTMYLAPDRAGTIWAVAIAAAVVANLLAPKTRIDPRSAGTIATAVIFVLFLMAITGGNPRTTAIIPALFVAAAYVVLGIWTGRRFAWLGLVIATIVLGAWAFAPQLLFLAIGIGGGGALILAGVWMRRA